MKKHVINYRKKAAAALLGAVVLVFLVANGCDKLRRFDPSGIDASMIPIPCGCIMDTLKGEWNWYKMGNGWTGEKANWHKSVIKITNQNTDGSINYEVWVKGTLFWGPNPPNPPDIFVNDTLWFQGSFQIQEDMWMYANNIKLPHYGLHSRWYFYFIGKDELIFFDGALDGNHYYYEKIK
jgi:hypothetical protein